MISGLLPRAEEILSMEEGPEKESCARQLLLELENCPVDEAFPFEEPVEWEKLAAACEGNGIHLQIPEEELQDRIRGAWTGRASGCLLGVPVEGWSREKIWKKAASIRWKAISVPIQSGRSGRNTA